MIYENIRQFLGSQNFALVSTNVPEICVLRNVSGSQGIFCVIVDHTRTRVYSAGQLAAISSQLESRNSAYGTLSSDVLFIVITGSTGRDRALTQSGLKVWLADAFTGSLIIYEDQPSDFYGLRYGIESAVANGYNGYDSSSASSRTRTSSKLKKNFPYVTAILIALNVIYYIILSLLGNTQSTRFMAAMGANYSPYVFEDFQIWRLVTCMFMHFGISHLASNMIYLGLIGYNLERITGHFKFFLIYMLSGIGSSVISAAYYYITDTATLSAGASGAIYGLVGAVSYLTFRNFRYMKPMYIFWRISMILLFVFYSSFISTGVDGAAHIGGFFFGLVLGFFFIRPLGKTSR